MTHIFNVGHSALSKPVGFEWQNGKQQIDVSADLPHSVRSPGPNLRADVIDHTQPSPVQSFGEPQVELWPVNQNDGVRLSFQGGVFQFSKGSQEFLECPADLKNSHDGQVVGVNDRIYSGRPHRRAGGSEKLDLL